MRVKQRDNTDCGAACLSSVAGYYSLEISVARARQLAGTNEEGTSLMGMVTAAEQLGFEAKGVRCGFDSLLKIPLPAVAHIQVRDMSHYVVIYKATANKIKIMDPSDGRYSWRRKTEFNTEWTGILMLVLPEAGFKANKGNKSMFSRFWALLKPHQGIIFQCLLGALIYTVLGLSTSVFIQKITDNVLADGNRELLNMMGMIMIGLLLFQLVLNYLKAIFTLQTGQKIDAKLITGYYVHLLHMPQQFFDTMRVGEMMTRISDAVKIRVFLNDVAIGLVVNFLTVVMAFALMFIYYWKLAMLLFMIFPLYLLIYFITNKVNKKIERLLMERAAELETVTVNNLQSAGTVKALAIENYATEQISSQFFPLLRTSYLSGKAMIFGAVSSEMITQLLTITLLWVGADFVLNKELSAGELFSFFSLVGYFTGPMASLIHSNKFIQDALIAADRLFEILDLEVESELGMVIDKISGGNIRLENIHFGYLSSNPVLEGISMTIKEGTCVAIVGESGSGKSTILDIIQKRYLPSEGHMYLGDISYRNLSYKHIRKSIGIISQHVDFFTGTIMDNITIGDMTPNDGRIIDVLRRLGMNEFIESLPEGMYTKINAHGLTLSGGQRQRLAIARALYRNYPIILMDEPSSALDARAESFLQVVIKELLSEGKTVVIVSHRLASIQYADEIIFLEKGKIMEKGKHDALLERNGQYAELWRMQNTVTDII